MKYLIIIEKDGKVLSSAYVPDRTGVWWQRAHSRRRGPTNLSRRSIQLHLKGMRETGDPIPEPTSTSRVRRSCFTRPSAELNRREGI